MAGVGVQSELDVESSPTVRGPGGALGKPSTWSWIWFVVAVLVVFGFHIRMFGRAIPPAAHMP